MLELSRAEYLHLLQMAKLLNKEKVYLLMFALTGIYAQELSEVTVEAVQEGSERKGESQIPAESVPVHEGGVESVISLLVEQAMERMMEQEQFSVGWDV